MRVRIENWLSGCLDTLRLGGRDRGTLALWLVIAASLLFRVVGLDHLPGVNGDEGYLGVKVVLFLRGDPISLKTGTDLYGDPISLGISCLLHSLFGISFWTLRLTTVLTGVLNVWLLYACARRFYGGAVASVTAAIAACMPTAIAYSRFFWEPSQSPLVASAWLYAALSRRIGLTIVLGALAIVVHPTNVFLSPVIFIPYLQHFAHLIRQHREGAPTGRMTPLTKGLLTAIPLFSVLLVLAQLYHDHSRVLDAVAKIGDRITNEESFREFLGHYPGLFTGGTVYAYIVRPLTVSEKSWFDAAFLALFVLPVLLSIILDWRKLSGLVLGLLLALGAFYLIAGPEAIAPNSERYALWMISPHCLIAAIAWQHLAGRCTKQHWLTWFTAMACGAWLLTFYTHYFRQLMQTNSETELAFGTGSREPKQLAIETILRQSHDQRLTRIYTEDWWTYWALKYLALGEPEAIEVTIYEQGWDRRFPVDFLLDPLDETKTRAFYVGYTGGSLVRKLSNEKHGLHRIDIEGFGGKRLITVLASP